MKAKLNKKLSPVSFPRATSVMLKIDIDQLQRLQFIADLFKTFSEWTIQVYNIQCHKFVYHIRRLRFYNILQVIQCIIVCEYLPRILTKTLAKLVEMKIRICTNI